MADPKIPGEWRSTWLTDLEDAYGREDVSGAGMPAQHGPMYDPGGTGSETAGMSDSPWRDFSKNTTASMNLAMLAMAPPGLWKALTLPTFGPLSAKFGFDAYRNVQQLNGDHPTQLRQQQWEPQVQNALARLLMSGGYNK